MAKSATKPKPQESDFVLHSFEVGLTYFIRTVSMYYVGRLVRITETDLLLEDAAWIGDTGRFFNFLKDGKVKEVEPFPDPVIISRAVIVDATIWRHAILREQK